MTDTASLAEQVVRKATRIARQPLLVLRVLRQTLAFYGSPMLVARKAWRAFRQEGLKGVMRRARAVLQTADIGDSKLFRSGPVRGLFDMPPPLDATYMPLVSIIVPNFNHARYLRDRLESIYRQNYSHFEVILLDDASSDDSLSILREFAERYASKTSLHTNVANSGGVFHQWKKGLALARGSLIWIAESDDYCESTHLSELVGFFRNEAVALAFCRSEFVRGDELSALTITVLIDSAKVMLREAFGITRPAPDEQVRVGSATLHLMSRWRV